MLARHLPAPARREEPPFAVQLVQLVLRPDKGMLGTQERLLPRHIPPVGRQLSGNGPPRDDIGPPVLVGGFQRLHMPALARKQRSGRPGRSQPQPYRVRAGAHRREHRVPPVRVDVLAFVADQQQAGRLAARVGGGRAGEEVRAGLADLHDKPIPHPRPHPQRLEPWRVEPFG